MNDFEKLYEQVVNMTRQDTYDMSSDTLCAKAYKLAHEEGHDPDLALLVDELIVRVQVYTTKSKSNPAH
jgi:hypothetical protein